MADTYFKYFPKIIDEHNNEVLDLLTHVYPINLDQLKIKSLETIKLSDNDFAERVAHALYQDSNLFYPMFLINEIINPYDEWVLQEHELHRCTVEKYNADFLEKHKKEVMKQYDKFFQELFSFELSQSLPMGNYVLRIFYGERKMSGEIHLSLQYSNQSIKHQVNDVLPFLDLSPGEYEHQFYLGNTTNKMTKIHVANDSHLHLNIKPLNAAATSKNNLLSSNRRKIKIPFDGKLSIPPNNEVFLEFDIETNLPIYLYGSGNHIILELYNSSAYLIQQIFSKTDISIDKVISRLEKFVPVPVASYENRILYQYSEKLIKKILYDILDNIMDSNRIEVSSWRLFKKIRDEYEQRFDPKLFSEESAIRQSYRLNQQITKVYCAAQFKVDLNQTIKELDGVALQSFKKVLLINQPLFEDNGIYIVNDQYSLIKYEELNKGSIIYVERGSMLKETQWIKNELAERFQRIDHQDNDSISTLKKLDSIVKSDLYHYYQHDVLNDIHHYETTESNTIIDEKTISSLLIDDYKRVTNLEYESQQNDIQRQKLALIPNYMGYFIKQYRNYLFEEQKIE